MVDGLKNQLKRLQLLHRIGVALSSERNRDRLIELILIEAKAFCHADGGTLYLRTEEDHLKFAIMRTESLGIALGGTTGKAITLPPIPLYSEVTGEPNHGNIATYCALRRESVHIPDAYHAAGFDFTGTRAFDAHNNYRSTSLFTVPLVNSQNRVIGVLQLLNATDKATGKPRPFSINERDLVEALASQAAIALDNQMLVDSQRELLESFIKLIAAAIDHKSPYTGAHCERVPILVKMLSKAAVAETEGPLSSFTMTPEEQYELHIASWLHDCGKIITPVHVMDKATKLETIYDRIDLVRTRFEVARRDVEIAALRDVIAGKITQEQADAAIAAVDASLSDDIAFIEKANIGAEFMRQADKDRIDAIAARCFAFEDGQMPLITEDEAYNLKIPRGTLTPEERIIINGHMVETVRMLEALPFPRHLRRVPEYAGGHHEKIDGTGYPKGLYAGDMSIPARMMAIADVFEALTAQDRPYKPGKTLSESMRIMGFMKRDNHLDPDLLDLFVRSGLYKQYASMFLPPEQIDEVDEEALLSIVPRSFLLPAEKIRAKQWIGFLPEYLAAYGEESDVNAPDPTRQGTSTSPIRRPSGLFRVKKRHTSSK